jgi:ATP-dependent 26S proteasome regulatory subunit
MISKYDLHSILSLANLQSAKVMKSELQRLTHEKSHMTDKIKDNADKIENNRQLPYLVGKYLRSVIIDADYPRQRH